MSEQTIFHPAGTVTTLLGLLNQFHGFSDPNDLHYRVFPETTLDYKYGVHLQEIQAPQSVPVFRYFGIGINGFRNLDTATNAIPHQPLATNLDLYQPIPFRVRPLEDDLTASERTDYRLRVPLTVEGVKYVAYYLKRIHFDPANVELIQRAADGTETPHTLDSSQLYPEPPTAEIGGLVTSNLNSLIVRATGECVVTGKEIQEARTILLGMSAQTSFQISEYGFYTGCEYWVDSNEELCGDCSIVPKTAAYVNKEAVYVQLAKHQCTLGDDLTESSSSVTTQVTFEAANTIEV